jgi:hypothetical protein
MINLGSIVTLRHHVQNVALFQKNNSVREPLRRNKECCITSYMFAVCWPRGLSNSLRVGISTVLLWDLIALRKTMQAQSNWQPVIQSNRQWINTKRKGQSSIFHSNSASIPECTSKRQSHYIAFSYQPERYTTCQAAEGSNSSKVPKATITEMEGSDGWAKHEHWHGRL